MDVPYFIKEQLWSSASDEALFNIFLVRVNPPQIWPGKQYSITVVDAVMILEVTNN